MGGLIMNGVIHLSSLILLSKEGELIKVGWSDCSIFEHTDAEFLKKSIFNYKKVHLDLTYRANV